MDLEKEYINHINESSVNPVYDTNALVYTRPLFKLLPMLIGEQVINILDIGAAFGTMSMFLKKKGFNITSLDIWDGYWEKEKLNELGIATITCDLLKAELPINQDLILFTETLEHIASEPVVVLDKICKSLSTNGKVLFSTPDCNSSWGKSGSLQGDINNYRDIPTIEDGLNPDLHRYVYCVEEIKEMFERAGFAIEYLESLKTAGEQRHIYCVARNLK